MSFIFWNYIIYLYILIFPRQNVLWNFKIKSHFTFRLFLNIVLIFMRATIYISSSSCRVSSTYLPDFLSRHPSPSSIAPRRSSKLYPVSAQSCCIYVVSGRPAFARPREGVYWRISLMSSSFLLQQCPACLVRLTWIVFLMGGRTAAALWSVASRICSNTASSILV